MVVLSKYQVWAEKLLKYTILSYPFFVLLGFHRESNWIAGILCVLFLYFAVRHGPKKIRLLKRDQLFILAISVPLFLSFVSILWSVDMHKGIKSVETKALLFILPIISLIPQVKKISLDSILKSFLIATLMACIFGSISGFLQYLETGDSGFLYSDNLAYATQSQAIYLSISVNLCFIIIIYLFENGRLKLAYLLAAGLFLIIMSFLLAARLSMLAGFAIIGLYSLYKLKSTPLKVRLTVLIGFIVLALSLSIVFPKTIGRFRSLASSFNYSFDNSNGVNHFNGEISPENWNGLTLRLAIWQCGLELVAENLWLGIGIGDYKQALIDKYQEKKFKYALQQCFGIHNQYLYYLLTTGFIGIVLFLYSFYHISLKAFQNKNYLYLLLLSVFLVSFITESVLNKFIGVFPYAYLLTFSFSLSKNRN
ncbi:MAG: O-antigen ligase family protein [Fulvivirga sp.]